MKYIAADLPLLAQIGCNRNPSKDTLIRILQAAGIEPDTSQIDSLFDKFARRETVEDCDCGPFHHSLPWFDV
jgi:ribosomal protein L12E/L44/L45/RPP1/RPP2